MVKSASLWALCFMPSASWIADLRSPGDGPEFFAEPAELQHRHTAPYRPEDGVGHGLDRVVDGLHKAARRVAGEPGEKYGGDDETEEYVVRVVHGPL